MVALERSIFKLTKSCIMSEKIEPKWACYNSPASKYVGRDVTLEGASCNTDLFLILFGLSGWNLMKSTFCSFYTSDTFVVLSASSVFVNFPKDRKQIAYPDNQFGTWQKDHFVSC